MARRPGSRRGPRAVTGHPHRHPHLSSTPQDPSVVSCRPPPVHACIERGLCPPQLAAWRYRALRRGARTVNETQSRDPPGRHADRAPIISVRRLQIARPRPVPPYFRAWSVDLLNDSNRRSTRSGGMPMPVSGRRGQFVDRPGRRARRRHRQHHLAHLGELAALLRSFRGSAATGDVTHDRRGCVGDQVGEIEPLLGRPRRDRSRPTPRLAESKAGPRGPSAPPRSC